MSGLVMDKYCKAPTDCQNYVASHDEISGLVMDKYCKAQPTIKIVLHHHEETHYEAVMGTKWTKELKLL